MAEFEPRGVTVRDVKASAFIAAFAEYLKNNNRFEVPSWADIVKTGKQKELAPYDEDWYYIRAAAVARKIYLHPCTGVGALQRRFGTKNKKGVRTEHHSDSSAGIIRHILQQLEELKLVEKDQRGGRRISRVGQQALDKIATQVVQAEA